MYGTMNFRFAVVMLMSAMSVFLHVDVIEIHFHPMRRRSALTLAI